MKSQKDESLEDIYRIFRTDVSSSCPPVRFIFTYTVVCTLYPICTDFLVYITFLFFIFRISFLPAPLLKPSDCFVVVLLRTDRQPILDQLWQTVIDGCFRTQRCTYIRRFSGINIREDIKQSKTAIQSLLMLLSLVRTLFILD